MVVFGFTRATYSWLRGRRTLTKEMCFFSLRSLGRLGECSVGAYLQPKGRLERLVQHLGGHLLHHAVVHRAVLRHDVDGGGVQGSWKL